MRIYNIMTSQSFSSILAALAVLIVIITMRVRVCLPSERRNKLLRANAKAPVSLLLFFGSGGHTTEMLSIVKNLSIANYSPVHLVLGHSDKTSQGKILDSQNNLLLLKEDYSTSSNMPGNKHSVYWHTIHRSREVKQSIITTFFSTIVSLLQSILLIFRLRPQVLLCNGPGSCVCLCYALFVLRIFGINSHSQIIFVESFCRVQDLSLSGKLLYPIADQIVVQWPNLTKLYPRTQYLGKIC